MARERLDTGLVCKFRLKGPEGADISHISDAEIISLHINMNPKLLSFMTFERGISLSNRQELAMKHMVEDISKTYCYLMLVM